MANIKLFRWVLLFLAVIYIKHGQCCRFEYSRESSRYPDILVDAEFTITIKVFKNKKETGQRIIKTEDGKDTKITGSYDGGNKSRISVQFKDSVNWDFRFEERYGIAYIKPLVEFVPATLFKEPSLNKKVQYKQPEETVAGLWTDSYQCNKKVVTSYIAKSEIASDFHFEVTTSVVNFQAQGFNIIAGVYGPVVHCHGDSSGSTLPSPTTTVATTTLTPPKPSPPTVNKYLVKQKDEEDNFCIEFIGLIEFEIDYVAMNSEKVDVKKTAKIGIPKMFKASGYCNTTPQRLVINFYEDWFLAILISESKSRVEGHNPDIMFNKMAANSTKLSAYFISNITLSYSMHKELFPNAKLEEKTRKVLNMDYREAAKLPSKEKNQGYYQCEKGVTINFGNDAKLHMSHMKFKAFNENSDETFKGEPAQCAADNPGGSGVNWSAFGYAMLALGLLGIIILVIVLIVRRQKKKRGYNEI